MNIMGKFKANNYAPPKLAAETGNMLILENL